ASWTAQQMVECCAWDRKPPRFFVHDRDSCYGATFHRIVPTVPRACPPLSGCCPINASDLYVRSAIFANLEVGGGIRSSASPVTGDVDLDGHAPNGGSIEAFNGGFGFRLGWHLHKTESPRLTSSPVGDEIDFGDLAESDKQVLEFVLGDRKRQIAYIDIHDIL